MKQFDKELRATEEWSEWEQKGIHERVVCIAELERDRDALLESYETLALEELDDLTPEEQHGFYRTLRVVVYAHPDGGVEVRGAFMSFDPPGPDSPTSGDGAGPDRNGGSATRRGFSTNKGTRGHAAIYREWRELGAGIAAALIRVGEAAREGGP